MKRLKDIRSSSVKEEVKVSDIEELLPLEFIEELSSDIGPSRVYLEESAPWLRLEGETFEEYQMYQIYQSLPQHIWNLKKAYIEFELYFNSSTIDEITFTKFKVMSETNRWHIRRYAYILYSDWLLQQEDMRQQLMMIADYRRNQSILAKEATEAGLVLIHKLRTKIDDIESDDIRIQDIPRFVTAVKDITAMASDSEARLLSINMLLDLHSKDIAEMFKNDIPENLVIT